MGIENKQTYGEYYWAMQVEANKLFADESDKLIAPYITGLLDDIPDLSEVPPGTRKFIEALKAHGSFEFLPFAAGVGINALDEVLDVLFEGPMTVLKRFNKRGHRETWLTTPQVNTLWARKKITEGLWNESTASEGYQDVLASSLFEAQLPYPTIPDIVLYSRYHGDPNAPWGEFQKWWNISPREWPVWKWLGQQRLTTLQVQTLFRRGIIDNYEQNDHFARIGWLESDREFIKEVGWSIPNAMLLVQGNLQQQAYDDKILSDISIADIHPDYSQLYLDAVLTKPSSQDLIAYHLRRDPGLADLDADLKKIGIHPAFNEVYRTLAYPIPPVADIITMAVREAFSPEIAARFGQYEDYPPDFEEWAVKKGLTPEWSQRYWAAHWSLPSANQGFEMLHRGVIDESELNLLLRALDVMPFWRDKLLQIAHRRLTRVDVRRMYRVGVLDEGEVYRAYREQGYNERDAKRMSDFTVQQTLATQSKFTARDVVSAYSKYMIDKSETGSLLREVGVRPENVAFIISSADYKRQWELTESRIAAVRNLYKKKVYDENKARAELLRLDLPAVRVDVLMSQWYIDEKDKPPRLWTTAQTLGFMAEGLISRQRGKQELETIGYDEEHINVYLRGIKWPTETS